MAVVVGSSHARAMEIASHVIETILKYFIHHHLPPSMST